MSRDSKAVTRCHITGCRRSVSKVAIRDQYPKADGWALVSSNYSGWHVFICPIHRLELEEYGQISPKAKPGAVYGKGRDADQT